MNHERKAIVPIIMAGLLAVSVGCCREDLCVCRPLHHGNIPMYVAGSVNCELVQHIVPNVRRSPTVRPDRLNCITGALAKPPNMPLSRIHQSQAAMELCSNRYLFPLPYLYNHATYVYPLPPQFPAAILQ